MEVLIKCITLKSHGRGCGGMGVKTEDDWKKREQKLGEREKETEKRERGQTRETERIRQEKGREIKEIKMQNLGMGGSLLWLDPSVTLR